MHVHSYIHEHHTYSGRAGSGAILYPFFFYTDPIFLFPPAARNLLPDSPFLTPLVKNPYILKKFPSQSLDLEPNKIFAQHVWNTVHIPNPAASHKFIPNKPPACRLKASLDLSLGIPGKMLSKGGSVES